MSNLPSIGREAWVEQNAPKIKATDLQRQIDEAKRLRAANLAQKQAAEIEARLKAVTAEKPRSTLQRILDDAKALPGKPPFGVTQPESKP